MTLRTFEVPWKVGRVRFVTFGESRTSITVETFDEKKAFTFEVQGEVPISSGRIICYRGNVRLDPSIKRDGNLAHQNIYYYHNPHDKTDKREWSFWQLTNAEFFILKPAEVVLQSQKTLQSAMAISNKASLPVQEALEQARLLVKQLEALSTMELDDGDPIPSVSINV